MGYVIGICDSDDKFSSKIEEYILYICKLKNVRVEVYVWKSGETCINDILKNEIDIMFLDIDIVDYNGIKLAGQIKLKYKNNVNIVFISDVKNLTVEVFNVKPYTFIPKNGKFLNEIYKVIDELIFNRKKHEGYIYSLNQHIYVIEYDDMIYLESDKRQINIHLDNGEIKSFVGKIDEQISRLNSDFIKVSQSYIINTKKIKEYQGTYLVMQNDDIINISRGYRLLVKESIKNR